MPEDNTLYTLHQSKKRAIIPKIISLLILGTIFYTGILINVALLEVTPSEETTIKFSSLIGLLAIILTGILLAIHRARIPYRFYPQQITFNKETLAYTAMVNTTSKQDLLDKLFHTYSIPLTPKFVLRHIPNEIAIENYLHQLREYAQQNFPEVQPATSVPNQENTH